MKIFKLSTLLFCLIIFVGSTNAQWQKTFGRPSTDYMFDIDVTEDGQILTAGYWNGYGLGGEDMGIVKQDSATGNPWWGKRYGGSGSDRCYDFAASGDSIYLMVGTTVSYGAGGIDAFIVATDTAGTIKWSKTYGGTGDDYFYGVTEIPGSGFALCGRTNSFGSTYFDNYVVRINYQGDTLWTFSYGGTLGDDLGRQILFSVDGELLISGRTQSFGSGNVDVYLMKMDTSGNYMWEAAYGHIDADYGNGIVQAPGGTGSGYVIAFASYTNGIGNWDDGLLHVDSAGDVVWARSHGGTGQEHAWQASYLTATSDGGYAMTGRTYSTGVYGDRDIYLAKFNGSGNLSWSRVYGGGGADEGCGVEELPTGGYVIGSSTVNYGNGGWDFYVVKTDDNGISDGCRDQAITFSDALATMNKVSRVCP